MMMMMMTMMMMMMRMMMMMMTMTMTMMMMMMMVDGSGDGFDAPLKTRAPRTLWPRSGVEPAELGFLLRRGVVPAELGHRAPGLSKLDHLVFLEVETIGPTERRRNQAQQRLWLRGEVTIPNDLDVLVRNL